MSKQRRATSWGGWSAPWASHSSLLMVMTVVSTPAARRARTSRSGSSM